jgi:hypothetical protein
MEQEISHFFSLFLFKAMSNILHHFNLFNGKYKPNNTNQWTVMQNIWLWLNGIITSLFLYVYC